MIEEVRNEVNFLILFSQHLHFIQDVNLFTLVDLFIVLLSLQNNMNITEQYMNITEHISKLIGVL